MKYLGLDVHAKATVWCLLDADGQVAARGKVATTAPALTALVERLREKDELLAGQEVGTMSYFVHDVMTAAGAKLLSFNALHLRMIASSRKKTDRRDAYWIAKALQTGMTPTVVYLPSGQTRRLRSLLSQRDAFSREHRGWVLRAKTAIRARGLDVPKARSVAKLYAVLSDSPEGIDVELAETLQRYRRVHEATLEQLAELEATIRRETHDIDAIRRLQTIPGVGEWVARTLYACVGDVTRFPSARQLTSYAGLVPSVWQSADTDRLGAITKQGSPALRRMLIQAGHVLLWRCKSEDAAPLKALALRVYDNRKRSKVAVVAAARHILRIAYYVLRDGTSYDPTRMAAAPLEAAE